MTLLTMVHEGCLTVLVVIDSVKSSILLETSVMLLFMIRNILSLLKKTYLRLNVFFILSVSRAKSDFHVDLRI